MRVLIQRVAKASVTVEDKVISKIDQGLLIFVCAMSEDTESQAETLAKKISNLRIFSDSEGKMNKSILDIQGHCLVASQFTLAADTKRGNRHISKYQEIDTDGFIKFIDDIIPKHKIYNPTLDGWNYGYQMIFMNYQLYDSIMKKYHKKFSNSIHQISTTISFFTQLIFDKHSYLTTKRKDS